MHSVNDPMTQKSLCPCSNYYAIKISFSHKPCWTLQIQWRVCMGLTYSLGRLFCSWAKGPCTREQLTGRCQGLRAAAHSQQHSFCFAFSGCLHSIGNKHRRWKHLTLQRQAKSNELPFTFRSTERGKRAQIQQQSISTRSEDNSFGIIQVSGSFLKINKPAKSSSSVLLNSNTWNKKCRAEYPQARTASRIVHREWRPLWEMEYKIKTRTAGR